MDSNGTSVLDVINGPISGPDVIAGHAKRHYAHDVYRQQRTEFDCRGQTNFVSHEAYQHKIPKSAMTPNYQPCYAVFTTAGEEMGPCGRRFARLSSSDWCSICVISIFGL